MFRSLRWQIVGLAILVLSVAVAALQVSTVQLQGGRGEVEALFAEEAAPEIV